MLYLIVSRISLKTPSLLGYLNELFQEPTKFMIIYLPSIRSWRPSHLPAAAQSYDAQTTHYIYFYQVFWSHCSYLLLMNQQNKGGLVEFLRQPFVINSQCPFCCFQRNFTLNVLQIYLAPGAFKIDVASKAKYLFSCSLHLGINFVLLSHFVGK